MSTSFDLEKLFYSCKEEALHHRYITNKHIESLLSNLGSEFKVETFGHSVMERPIFGVTVGTGSKKILMWSQMHGNESTTTKALFDLFNCFSNANCKEILKKCTFCFIPILNPDGAKAYTRVNASNIDLNRDAQNLTQPESIVLKTVFEAFSPDFCFNLHGQRTIFSAGVTNNSATVSFLAPAQDKDCTVTQNRKKAMSIIVNMNDMLQNFIPNQVGVYDDAFNINCVGDTFQSRNVPTVLFEAGHYTNDYDREEVRKYIFMSLITALDNIANELNLENAYSTYFDIPDNAKLFYDIIIRNAHIVLDDQVSTVDIAIQYEEILEGENVNFVPKLSDFGDLSKYYAHKEIDANGKEVKLENNKAPIKGSEIDFVTINGELFSLKLVNN